MMSSKGKLYHFTFENAGKSEVHVAVDYDGHFDDLAKYGASNGYIAVYAEDDTNRENPLHFRKNCITYFSEVK